MSTVIENLDEFALQVEAAAHQNGWDQPDTFYEVIASQHSPVAALAGLSLSGKCVPDFLKGHSVEDPTVGAVLVMEAWSYPALGQNPVDGLRGRDARTVLIAMRDGRSAMVVRERGNGPQVCTTLDGGTVFQALKELVRR